MAIVVRETKALRMESMALAAPRIAKTVVLDLMAIGNVYLIRSAMGMLLYNVLFAYKIYLVMYSNNE